jgi:NADH-quinone oxidoreductase subunit K
LSVPISYYLILSALLFGLGVAGFFFRRSAVSMLLSVELMLHAVSLTLVTFSHAFRELDGQVFGLFIIVIGAAHAVLGLAIAAAVFRSRAEFHANRSTGEEW